jgi:hypothetical protein
VKIAFDNQLVLNLWELTFKEPIEFFVFFPKNLIPYLVIFYGDFFRKPIWFSNCYVRIGIHSSHKIISANLDESTKWLRSIYVKRMWFFVHKEMVKAIENGS